MAGNKNDEKPEVFLKEIQSVSQAEKSAQNLISRAQSKAQELISNASSHAVSITAKASSDAVEQKDKIILEKRQQTDQKIQKLLSDAQIQADRISKMRLGAQKASSIADSIL